MEQGGNRDGRNVSRRKLIGTACGTALGGTAGCLRALGSAGESTADAPETDGPDQTATDRTERPRVGLGPETFERLADLEAVDGTLSANTERQVAGTQCAALETGADGAWLHVPLDEPMDFRNARPACHVAADGSTAGSYLYLDLRDADGNRFRTRTVIRSRREPVRVDFGVTNPRVDGTAVDLANVTRLSFRPGPRSDSGSETVYLDHPSRVVAPETAAVAFQFDDGNETDYTEGLPYLSQYDYPAISYVNTESVGSDGRLDETQLRELADAGWLIGSHTTDHANLSELDDPAEIERRVRDAKRWLVERGFTDGARHFAYPYNAIDERALSIVSRYHDTGRVWDWQPVALPSNPRLVPGVGEATPSDARGLLDQAVQYGGVVTFYYHDLSDDDRLAEFQEVVDEVRRRERAGDLNVVGLDELAAIARDAL